MRSRSLLAFLLGASCAEPRVVPAPAPVGAAELLSRVEQRLLSAKTVRVKATIVATGAIAADLRATLVLEPPGRARLEATGTLATTKVDVSYDTAAVQRPPPFVREALVVGLVRMGLLHNVAVLHGGGGPDHAEGGVSDWVQAVGAAFAPPGRAVKFSIVVSGERSGEAELSIDEARMAPTGRTQTVRFAQGEMNVREGYEVEIVE